MIKKTLKYKKINGEDIIGDFYFNLTAAELVKMQFSKEGGLGEFLNRIIKAEDGRQIMDSIELILSMAYGEPHEDGIQFVKSDEISKRFMQTDAYNQLFVELVTNGGAAATFINAVIPQSEIEKIVSANEKSTETVELPGAGGTIEEVPRTYSNQELFAMNEEEWVKYAGTDPTQMDRQQLLVAMQRKAAGR